MPALVFLSVLLFVLAHPNPLLVRGFWPLSFLALSPLWILLSHERGLRSAAWGALWGGLSTAITMYWLGAYHGLALVVVLLVNTGFYLIAFPFLAILTRVRGWWGIPVLAGAWVGLEYLRTLGFLGNPYGAMGYTQAFLPFMLGPAAWGGVWLVGFLTVLPGVILARAWGWQGPGRPRRLYAPAGSWLVAFAVALVAVIGLSTAVTQALRVDYSAWPTKRLAVVQQNIDPWQGGDRAYQRNFDILRRLTDEAMDEDPDLVVWSETAIAPAIEYHLRYRESPVRYQLVRDVVDYLEGLGKPAIIGQNHAIRDGWLPDGSPRRLDYNAAYLVDGPRRAWYGKQHLVPFSEHFPFGDLFPWLFDLLVDRERTYWEEGQDPVVFEAAGMKFSTPICFEDSFGYLSRDFVNRGAQILVNLTNDTWSMSRPAMEQHLAMAVFRTVETRRAMVRATNGGLSAVIDPNGRITAELPAFEEAWAVVEAPLAEDPRTLYLEAGDWFPWVCLGLALALALARGARWSVDRLGKKAQYRNKRDDTNAQGPNPHR